MTIPVLVEPLAGGGYVARAGSPFDWSAEGATPAEAVEKVRAAARACAAGGCTVAAIDVPGANGATVPAEHSLARLAGSWKDDPTIDEFRQAIEDYRRAIDADPNR